MMCNCLYFAQRGTWQISLTQEKKKKNPSQTQDLTGVLYISLSSVATGQTLWFCWGTEAVIIPAVVIAARVSCYHPCLPRHYSANTSSRPTAPGIWAKRKYLCPAAKPTQTASPVLRADSHILSVRRSQEEKVESCLDPTEKDYEGFFILPEISTLCHLGDTIGPNNQNWDEFHKNERKRWRARLGNLHL